MVLSIKRIIPAQKLVFTASTGIITLLLVPSAILKFKSPALLAAWIHATFLLDVPSTVSYVIGLSELLTVIAIFIPRFRSAGLYSGAILSSGFIGVSLSRVIFSLSGNCGCYGAFAMKPSLQVGIASAIYILSVANLMLSRKQ